MSDNGPDSLGKRIAKMKSTRKGNVKRPANDEASDSSSAGAYALRYGTEFGLSIVVGGFLGYWIDHFAGTAPWGLFIMGAFGLAAGVLSMRRAYRQMMADAAETMKEPERSDDNGKTG